MPDYKVDSIPQAPMELKGNSAEGNIMEAGMKGFGKYADFSRPAERENNSDALGAFIQGNNAGNTTPAGSQMSANTVFNPGENKA